MTVGCTAKSDQASNGSRLTGTVGSGSEFFESAPDGELSSGQGSGGTFQSDGPSDQPATSAPPVTASGSPLDAGPPASCELALEGLDDASIADTKQTAELKDKFASNAEGIDVEVEISTEGAWESACVNVWLAQRGAPTFFLDVEETRLIANINRNEASDLARLSLVTQIDLARLTIPPPAPNP